MSTAITNHVIHSVLALTQVFNVHFLTCDNRAGNTHIKNVVTCKPKGKETKETYKVLLI